jgi:hypothetical protein
LERDYFTPLGLARKESWANQGDEGETLKQHEPSNQGMSRVDREAPKTLKRKEVWTTIAKKKKSS